MLQLPAVASDSLQHSIRGYLERGVLVYSAEASLPPAAEFWNRHRDTPALIHDAPRLLYSDAFRAALAALLPDGPHATLGALPGTITECSSHHTRVGEGNATVHTLASYLKRGDSKLLYISTPFIERAKEDAAASRSCTAAGVVSAQAAYKPLSESPLLFQHADILSLPRAIPDGTSRTMSQLYIGRAQCYSPTHVDYLTSSSGALIVSGEKLWLSNALVCGVPRSC
jgi:hypothetical protein